MNAYDQQLNFKPIEPMRDVLYKLTMAGSMVFYSIDKIGSLELESLTKRIRIDGLWQQPEMEQELYLLAKRTLEAMKGCPAHIERIHSRHEPITTKTVRNIVSFRESDYILATTEDGSIYAMHPDVAKLVVVRG